MRSVNRGRRQDQRKEVNTKKYICSLELIAGWSSSIHGSIGFAATETKRLLHGYRSKTSKSSRFRVERYVSLSLSFEPRYLEILKQVGKVCVHVCAHSARGTCIRHVYTAGACNVRANHDKCVYHDARDRISSKPSRASGNRRRRRSRIIIAYGNRVPRISIFIECFDVRPIPARRGATHDPVSTSVASLRTGNAAVSNPIDDRKVLHTGRCATERGRNRGHMPGVCAH